MLLAGCGATPISDVMITPSALREFALDCVGWAQSADPSNRRLILGMALTWHKTADALDPHVSDGGELRADLRSKLNSRRDTRRGTYTSRLSRRPPRRRQA